MTRAILTCSEHFTDLALNELKRYHPHLTVIHQLAPQHILIHSPGTFDQLTRPWRQKLPIYLHHLFPVHSTIPLAGVYHDLHYLMKAAKRLVQSEYTVQARFGDNLYLPYSPRRVCEHMNGKAEYHLDGIPSRRILSVLVAGTKGNLSGYLGVSLAAQNLSPWPAGRRSFNESVPNRAGLKLLEALETFAVRLWPGSHVLDLGAAPGAWTTILRRRGVTVTAVAPRPMYPWLEDDPGVRTFTMTAQEYRLVCDTVYDLITNDMILDAQDSARLMVDFAGYLRPQGIAIMTLKLRSRNRRRVMDHAFRILRKAYKLIRVRQLVSNRLEVTLFLRRKT